MKTDELVSLLAADGTVQSRPSRQLSMALVPGIAVAVAAFVMLAGWRPDLVAALASPRFVFKLTINAALVAVAAGLLLRMALPQAQPGRYPWLLWLLGGLLLLAVVTELALLPAASWGDATIGSNATWCLRIIPTLAAGPLVAALFALRRAAPGRPALAGAAAGLMSAGIGGLLYATHCPDDSPLFVALWYGCATAIVVAAGALAGARLLRW